jgi:histidine triad (HIT) family protein
MSIFEKIVTGDIPSFKLYEDDLVYAFLDIGPLSRGHALLIPKTCYVELDQMPPEVAAAMGRAMPRLCHAIKQATGCDGVNILQNNGQAAGQVVMHVHFHFIPRYTDAPAADDLGLDFNWTPGQLDPADAETLQAAITNVLSTPPV